MITFDIYVLMGASAGEKKATVKCNDTGVNLRIFPETLTELSARRFKTDPYSIPSGAVAVLKVSKSDGTPLEIPAKRVEKNSIFFKLPPQTFTVEGVASAEVSIFGSDGRRVTSDTFFIDVSKECVSDNVGDPVTQALAELSDGGGVEKPTTDDYLADLSSRQTELAGTLQKAGMEASPKEPYSTLVPKNAELVDELLRVEDDVKQELAELSDGGGVEKPTTDDYLADLSNRQTELAETLQGAGVEASPKDPYSTLVPKNAELVENLLQAEDDVKHALAGLSDGGGVDNPTTDDYLNDLSNQKTALAETLIESGVEASTDETFSTLVPKANEKIKDSTGDEMVALFNGTATTIPKVLRDIEIIPDYAFYLKRNLEEVDLPNATTAGKYAFANDRATAGKLKRVNLPKLTTIGDGAFQLYGNSVKTIYLPEATKMGSQAFAMSWSLGYVILPKITNIGTQAFNECVACTLVLPQNFIPTLTTTNWFNCKEVYVPKNMIEQYAEATNWTAFVSKTFAIEDNEEVLAKLAEVGYNYVPTSGVLNNGSL